MAGWMDGWMHGCIYTHGCTYTCIYTLSYLKSVTLPPAVYPRIIEMSGARVKKRQKCMKKDTSQISTRQIKCIKKHKKGINE